MMNISDVRRDSMDILFKNDDFVFSMGKETLPPDLLIL